MALAGAGDWATAETQLGMLRQRAPKDATGLVGDVLIPLVEGIQAFARRSTGRRSTDRAARAADRGARGSRAQRDVFHDTLLEACFRAGDGERATRLLAERVARRPDHYWRHRGAPAA